MNSNADIITTLLDRFYAGLTSAEEERRLLGLLSDPAYAADHAVVAAGIGGPDMPGDLNARLERFIGVLDATRRSRRRRMWWGATAAVAALAVVMTVALRPRRVSPYEVTDPMTAYQESMRAFTMMDDELSLSRQNAASELIEAFADFDLGFDADSIPGDIDLENDEI